MDEGRWSDMRALFEAVCDLPAEQWRDALEGLTQDPELLRETLELLDAQTHLLERARGPVNGLISQLSSSELRVGDTLGPWRLTERLAVGGMGVVFAAERADFMYDRQVAVKLLHGMADPRVAERLAEERSILAGLQHPNIARLYDGGTTAGGLPYLVMEFVDGKALDAYCREQRLDLRARLQLFERVCRAVQAAHGRLVIHCDLKPGNVLVRADGEPMLLDFGIARLLDASGHSERTGFCTPAYAAPEALGGDTVGVAADVFSLGIILLELLSGRRSERRSDDAGVPVPQPSVWADPATSPWRRRLRGDLDAIVGKACALDPAQRYVSAEALADDVRRYLDRRSVVARGGSRLYHLGRGLRRHWQASTAVAAGMVICALFVWQLGEQREQAEQEAMMAEQVSNFLLESFEAADPRRRGKGEGEASVRELLDAGAARIDTELKDTPEIRARVQHVMGQAYFNVGINQRGEELLAAAAESLLSPAVNRPLEAVAALNELAVIMANGSRGGEAEKTAQRSLDVLAGLRGGTVSEDALDDMATRAWNSMGLALADQERFEEALAAYQRAKAARANYPDAELRANNIDHNIGMLYMKWERFPEAEALLRQTLAKRVEIWGREAYSVWVTRHVLGRALQGQGKLQEVYELQKQNLALGLKLFGEDSDNTALVYNELAGISQDLGLYTRSADYYQHALQIRARISGEDSADYMMTLNNVATLEENRGDQAGAIALFRRSYQYRLANLGAEHSATLRAGANLGRALMRDGQLTEAKPLLERSIAVWSTRLEPAASDLLRSRLGLAEWETLSQQFGPAGEQLEALRPLLEGQPPALQIRYQVTRAQWLQAQGRAAEAAAQWQQVVALSETEYGATSLPAARLRVPWAETLLTTGQGDQARQQYQLALSALQGNVLEQSELMQRLAGVGRRLG